MNHSLPSLHSFPTVSQPEPEVFGAALQDPSVREVHCVCEPENEEAARLYAETVGIRSKLHLSIQDSIPHEALAAERTAGIVPLFVDSATNADLHTRFFRNPSVVGFVDHQYVRSLNGADSLSLRTVGTTEHGLAQLPVMHVNGRLDALRRERSARMKQVLGSNIVTYMEMRDILASSGVRGVRMHALGPVGTNIQQASGQYLASLKLNGKAELIVHPRGVEPVAYAELARQDMADGVVPLHMECAVYYGMRDLYHARIQELVFADHHYMSLDEMQLAAPVGSQQPNGQSIRLASHPSPIDLMHPWLQSGHAKWLKATSNSAAAQMVHSGEADACITTESSRADHGLKQWHSFGSPMMVFTIGTPYSMRELRDRFAA